MIAFIVGGAGGLPNPIPIGNLHFALALDPIGAQVIGAAALRFATPAISLPLADGRTPAGTGFALQAFAFEAAAMGIKHPFTGGVGFGLPQNGT